MPLTLTYLLLNRLHPLDPIILQLRTLGQMTRPKVLPTPLQRIEIRNLPLMLIALVFFLKPILCRAIEQRCLLLLALPPCQTRCKGEACL